MVGGWRWTSLGDLGDFGDIMSSPLADLYTGSSSLEESASLSLLSCFLDFLWAFLSFLFFFSFLCFLSFLSFLWCLGDFFACFGDLSSCAVSCGDLVSTINLPKPPPVSPHRAPLRFLGAAHCGRDFGECRGTGLGLAS